MRRLAIERGPLVRVLAVPEVVNLLEDEREMTRERVPRDLVEVGRDLGVVSRDRAERLGGQLGTRLRADRAELAELRDDARVVRGIGNRGHPRCIPRGRSKE